MAQNEIVEVSATSNDRKTNRRVLVASLSIQKVRLTKVGIVQSKHMTKKKPNDNKAEVTKWGAIAAWPFQLIRLLRQFGLSLSIS